MYHVLSGTGLYFDNGELKPVTAGYVMICKDGEEHMLENDGTEDLDPLRVIRVPTPETHKALPRGELFLLQMARTAFSDMDEHRLKP